MFSLKCNWRENESDSFQSCRSQLRVTRHNNIQLYQMDLQVEIFIMINLKAIAISDQNEYFFGLLLLPSFSDHQHYSKINLTLHVGMHITHNWLFSWVFFIIFHQISVWQKNKVTEFGFLRILWFSYNTLKTVQNGTDDL